MIPDNVEDTIEKAAREYKLRLEAAQDASKRLTIKRTSDPKNNHLRVIEFMTLQNEELEKRGLRPDRWSLGVCRHMFRIKYNQEAPGV